MNNDPRLIVALDFADPAAAIALARSLSPDRCRLKVGLELYTLAGRALVRELQDMGYEIFLDLKFHDIPNTVAAACRQAAQLGVWMLNVHALGGRRMLAAAREAVECVARPPRLIAVTVLTSHTDAELAELGLRPPALNQVLSLAALTADCGLDGVVCSAREAAELRRRQGDGFVLVTPGIRLADDSVDDQARVMTPGAALAAGSDYLVIGRSITRADDPLAAIARCEAAIQAPGGA